MKIKVEKDTEVLPSKAPWKVYIYTDWGRVMWSRSWHWEKALEVANVQANAFARARAGLPWEPSC